MQKETEYYSRVHTIFAIGRNIWFIIIGLQDELNIIYTEYLTVKLSK